MTTDSAKHHFSKDGSSTLYSDKFGQFYHNPNGAVSESNHVFFDIPGVNLALNNEPEALTVFEVGFGTGLNFLLLLDRYLSGKLAFPVHFYSVEAFPVSKKMAESFNFDEFLTHKKFGKLLPGIFGQLQPGLNTIKPLPEHEVYLHLFYGFFDELDHIDNTVDFIFHDAFSPEVNKELWTVGTFRKLASFGKKNAVLSTYCAASKARAAMAKAGWKLAKAPGALGKREMTIASLSEQKISGFKRVNESRLIERFDAGEFG
ncbi:MAG: tRNA (5-methylaminomethyl-2-thiouridine)(34)-methyltransferase MnmD [Balneolaceae bacterium]|nr:tRNA (5-methylaminomethyl-2-thiouridine)(34)-methyltransferase MnmD [Balneolaceae bacterium]MBO6544955.1 tRNA (5-methylaminomethyl-2-thiouridine)(34)-methyltransferase MnmD [Balneolaceae bacterium]MBO6646351.1 tRNA (5-methylaminomethyl-2-thiouridine)(34)-methyltransferase MnmD [Balneolaceae bacterium]